MLCPSTIAPRARYSQWMFPALAAAILALGGCQHPAPTPQTDPEPASAPAVAPIGNPTPPPPALKPLRIAILVSCDQPEYAQAKRELIRIAGADNVEVFELDSSATNARTATDSLRRAGHDNVVAIGLLAARATHRLDVEKVVFCQVLNHAEYELLGPRRRGVLALPPMGDAARLWRSIEPGPIRVGVITGVGHDQLIEAARVEFAANDLELVHRVVSSDKETVLEFQRMLPEIQGYWLLPDNRVLSRSAIRDLMSLARRSNVGVLVNDPRFLALGAVISASTEPPDIAARCYELLLDARGAREFPESDMSRLRECRLEINRPTAIQLGYDLDAAPRELLAR
jgi:ABC-type uncharacterized transport system substrate-binding protein